MLHGHSGWLPFAPLLTSHGLHATIQAAECGIAYVRRSRMPTPAEDKHWYSFDFGPIHFLQYSTEHAFHAGSEQHA